MLSQFTHPAVLFEVNAYIHLSGNLWYGFDYILNVSNRFSIPCHNQEHHYLKSLDSEFLNWFFIHTFKGHLADNLHLFHYFSLGG